jgi:NADPH2:quinone reductase
MVMTYEAIAVRKTTPGIGAPERAQELRLRDASSLKSTFASHYADEISLFEVLDPSLIAAYRGVATGAKYVFNRSKAR